jgi:hypothetical protein
MPNSKTPVKMHEGQATGKRPNDQIKEGSPNLLSSIRILHPTNMDLPSDYKWKNKMTCLC